MTPQERSRATARAGVNIALVKYWGKRDAAANLPAVGSLSMTLAELYTETTVRFDAGLDADHFVLDGVPRDDARVFRLLDGIRALSGETRRAQVSSQNHVPTAAGLASSASGTAALAVAAWGATGRSLKGIERDPDFLALVRRGSGSAPRSLLPGLVELDRETGAVEGIDPLTDWPLRMIVARLGQGPKAVSSREGMARTAATSPYFAAWVASHPADLAAARQAIALRDLQRLGEVMERSTCRMHACMLGADPPLRYWRGRTLTVTDAVLDLRAQGIGAWYTMDAGPHVKVLCHADDAAAVIESLTAFVPPEDLIECRPGPGAHLVE
ncbi:MAG: diphosphomevalonate decarboxylase [Myxococcales bacterium]|nr:diphosphomevalonate decarboxylase [Myxococcales bacterium]